MNSVLKKITVIAAIGLAAGLIGTYSIYASTSHSVFSSFNKSKETVLYTEKNFSSDSLKSVELTSDTADITVKKSNEPETRVVLEGQKGDKKDYSIQAEQNGGVLDVEVIGKNKFFNMGFHWSPKLTVYVPDKNYGHFNISTDTGDVSIKDLKSDRANIETDTGDIDASGKFTVSKLNAESDTGDLSFNDYRGTSIDLSTDTGDIQAGRISKNAKVMIKTSTGDIQDLSMESASKDVHIESDTGNVELQMDQSPSDFKLRASSDTGDVEVSPDWKVNYEEKSDHKAKGKAGQGGFSVSVKTDTGDIYLK
ncbi:DUF4097 family beta strand repeat-containing protein [Fictibacillus sp. KU28468]|uniref:DUF4097 family beta strand repeat-containing protein n=1 Tax=Fictibacillus sp. KU28468 TaxID=2991053 RepID=UPI00223D2556|nr:DUF4097 family beta strand repeat-containing protein [Fictibacillus sp. KU28468]UZJ78814.1 DUF4097 domain-containing protein [Fictibacillus sp. KU28468]